MIAAVLALVLAGIGASIIVMTVKSTVLETNRRFPSGGSQTFSFTQGEARAIYVSQAGEGRINCEIPQMRAGTMTRPDSTFQITAGSRAWARVFEVKPGSSGDFTLTCTSERQAEFTVGDKPHVGVAVGAVLAAIACFVGALASAVTISVVTAIRRSRHRRRLSAMWATQPQWGPSSPRPRQGPPTGSLP
ncbi:serine/arginine repetitive matrix protein 2 [Streptomyces reniochalinae]|uniref:serine/arginine repetitive matrix protein 2 n=1 Tax=Streptomyces reniochalinae TaxID=2250578 RepID=UPI001FE4EA19|nr:serine/arginine repetitive matrix protein 2 [Streptomyces reniochalinae]